jgi:hypothetical protein
MIYNKRKVNKNCKSNNTIWKSSQLLICLDFLVYRYSSPKFKDCE